MAEIQPARITWNNTNLDPSIEKLPSYRLDISYIKYVNHDLTYGPEGIPQSFYLLINLNGALYREVPVIDGFITVDAVEGTPLDNIYATVANDITKPGFIFDGLYLNIELTTPVTESDRLTQNKTVFIKWIED